jgi:phosphonate transport system substrate-binding protein
MKRTTLTFCLVLLTALSGILLVGAAVAEDDPLILGVFPRRNATVTYKLFKPMVGYLSEQLHREVQLVTAKDFNTFWKGVVDKKYDIVHYNQYHYLKSHKAYGYQVILKNEEFGQDALAGSLLVRKDSGINSVADLKGKKIAFGGGPKAMIAYVVPVYLLQQAGLHKDDYEAIFAKNPPNAVLSVFYHQIDAAGAGDKVLNLNTVKSQIDVSQMEHLLTSDPIAHIPWAVKPGMTASLRDKIQQAMLKLNDTKQGKRILKNAQLTGIRIATDAEYDPHRLIIQSVLGESY